MAEHLIEPAQLARLLNPPLEDNVFLEMAINQYPQDVRNELIVAKPASFAEAVKLLKQLQGRKNIERSSEVSLDPQNLYRRPNNRQNNVQSPGSGADPTRPTGSAQMYRDSCKDSTQESGNPQDHNIEWKQQGHPISGNDWQG